MCGRQDRAKPCTMLLPSRTTGCLLLCRSIALWGSSSTRFVCQRGGLGLQVMVIAAGKEAAQQVQDFKFGSAFKACVISCELPPGGPPSPPALDVDLQWDHMSR